VSYDTTTASAASTTISTFCLFNHLATLLKASIWGFWSRFLWAGYHSCQPLNSVEALKGVMRVLMVCTIICDMLQT